MPSQKLQMHCNIVYWPVYNLSNKLYLYPSELFTEIASLGRAYDTPKCRLDRQLTSVWHTAMDYLCFRKCSVHTVKHTSVVAAYWMRTHNLCQYTAFDKFKEILRKVIGNEGHTCDLTALKANHPVWDTAVNQLSMSSIYRRKQVLSVNNNEVKSA